MVTEEANEMSKVIEWLNNLKDKVVLAHSLSNVVWIYYGAIVFCVFYMVARWPA
jgi:hypothetical protein